MTVLRAGVIGAGGIAGFHAQGYKKAKGVELVGICDIVEKRAAALAGKYAVPYYTSVEEMLADGIDIASVCVPNHLHKEVVIQCLEGGAHVLCEKPPATSLEQVRAMVRAARQAERHLSWEFNNRARPEGKMLKAMVDAGKFGRIYRAEATWVRNCGIPGWGGWFTQKALAGGGPAIDLLVHMLDLVMWLMDYPDIREVMAVTFQNHGPKRQKLGPWGKPASKAKGTFDVEDEAVALVCTADGRAIQCTTGWAGHIRQELVEAMLVGTKMGASLTRTFRKDGEDDTSVDRLETYQDEGSRPTIKRHKVPKDPAMGRIQGVIEWAEAVATGNPPPVPVEHGLRLMQIVDAIYESAQKGISVFDNELDSIDPDFDV